MTPQALDARSPVRHTSADRPRGTLRPGWPLSVLFLGFPLWWVTGFSVFIFLIAAVPMAAHLVRRRPIAVPRGFGLWLVFLVWMLAGAAVLWVHAPGSVGEADASRLFVFAYRALWYGAVTIAMLYVGNLTEQELPARRVARLLGFMFIVVACGGLLGVVAPRVEFPSLLEIVLPAGLAQNNFVNNLIHPVAADPSSFLGYEQARPVAPFAFANSWGANYAMYLPFFVIAWLGREGGWRRRVAPLVLIASVWPVIYSHNRGLWIGLALVALYVVFRLAAAGHKWAVRGLVAGALITGAVLLASPLQELLADRLATPHSNNRRVHLALATLRSTLTGSPVVGFGSTRDVQGTLESIAVGSAPDCPACSPPPLGTQGLLWMVTFSQGFVGIGLFLSFFAVRIRRHWRERSPYAIAGCCVLVLFALFLPIYDMLEAPFFTVMIALGLMWRLEATKQTETSE